MRLEIRHVTRYAFDAPVRRLIQSHRLWPSEFAGQRVGDWNVEMEGAVMGAGFRDGAGDWTRTAALRGPVEEVEVVVEGVVETEDLAGVLRGHREKVPPSAYLVNTRATHVTAEIRDLAAETLAGHDGEETLGHAHRLCHAVTDTVAYAPGETGTETTAAEALAGGRGVCQDQTHLLIALARASGIPARYVAGHLFATGTERGAGASHAWAELHVGDLGWVGFDATNRCCPDDRYVRLCSGFDARDGAPIRGMVEGQAQERLDVTVSVTEAAGQSQTQDGDASSQRQQ
ncbi:transglutaminase family protein [Roseivivax sp. CAU 1761]